MPIYPKANIIKRMKEVVIDFEGTKQKLRDKPLTKDSRELITKVRHNTLAELIDLVKRL
jgi:hypothetical protein